ncbi:FMN-linked oxidoreductase [Glarea lozoyensis ATCC 20868]|uniref:FMN-linked oxidoreductase n=1 Tax=Glarea lozoyensis (strain ATCC 20868 / MF5171) TaxID=1116229 RepID=S3CUK1_GLAL2|nr:FMN-linked oxidoreductase [Glarea lozoyensis ATCC 20868]EPE30092.1 FMN-linked oxidoreductase [Glarea lozoyensis ATCC 20868]
MSKNDSTPTTSPYPSRGPLQYIPFKISPPLLNSATPWATDTADLSTLYGSPHTGAVTIRTSLLSGFKQNRDHHQYTFFSTVTGHSTAQIKLSEQEGRGEVKDGETSSLNTFGYSPITFEEYTNILRTFRDSGFLTSDNPFPDKKSRLKPFVVSVTGSPEDIGKCCYDLLCLQNEEESVKSREGSGGLMVMMEINLSCPNIPEKPPPAYDAASLYTYLSAVAEAKALFASSHSSAGGIGLHVGIKTPPYTYSAQFEGLIQALEKVANDGGRYPLSFITATNTLGSCLVLGEHNISSLGSANGMGIGGMAGDALHPIALGNVKTIRSMLDASGYQALKAIQLIGVGGVKDKAGFERMKSVGAAAVGVGTAFGREGVTSFCNIAKVQCNICSTKVSINVE